MLSEYIGFIDFIKNCTPCVLICVLLALVCAAYIGLTLLFVDAVSNQPPTV